MFMHKSKKGFTIVELVIVIAVIAILAAVLIPTFSNLVKKANMSADQQAVRQMNTALAADGAVTPTDIFKLHEVLSEMGLTSEDYHPLTKGTYFFWDADLNRVLHVDDKYVVITPADYAGQTYTAGTSNWFSLNLEIKEEEVAITNNAVTVSNGAQMAYVLNKLNEGTTKVLDVTLNGTVDMMGAAFDLPQFTARAGYDIEISGGTIKNAVAVEYAQDATSEEEGHNGVYDCALIPSVAAGNSITISNVTFDNLNIKNVVTGNVGLLIGSLTGEATIENVTINNSTVIGHRNVGALVGYLGQDSNTATHGTLILKGNIDLNNVDVMTVGGRSGMLVGYKTGSATLKADSTAGATIDFDDKCSFGIYQCEQNTGSGLGLKDGIMTSQRLTLKDGKYVEDAVKGYPYVEKSLIHIVEKDPVAVTSAADFAAKYGANITVKGW